MIHHGSCSESLRASLVQVDGGEAVDVLHLLQGHVQFGAQHRGGAGLLRRRQDLLRLLSDRAQVFLQALQLRLDFLPSVSERTDPHAVSQTVLMQYVKKTLL